MPQIVRALRKPLLDRTTPIKTVGDMCFLITAEIIIPAWTAEQGWTTASILYKMLVQEPDMAALERLTRGRPFPAADVRAQAALAFWEFYRRIVANYEDAKARLNTDVYAGVPYAKSPKLSAEA